MNAPVFGRNLAEKAMETMQIHGKYRRDLLDKGVAIAFGPVFDPQASWGIALFYAEDEQTAGRIRANDPAVKAGMRAEVFPPC
jgi:uncharacterized protein YciI